MPMVDIHCHILPEVDDGPKSWEVSEEMCRMAAADGIEHIVATPHANDRYPYEREYLTKLRDLLQERIGPKPRIGLGCDFHLSYENLQDAMVNPQRYAIEGTQYMLAELSNYAVPVQIDDTFSRLLQLGITPVITHPERNPIMQKTPLRILQWVELGCVIQVTASAFTGRWGDVAAKVADWLLRRDAIHVLASDGHDTKSRPPVLSAARAAVAARGSEERAQALVDDNPRAIVMGQPLPYFPEPVMKN